MPTAGSDICYADVAKLKPAELLAQILKMEEGHADWAEMQRAQIEQMGLANYLARQTTGAASVLSL